MEEEGLPGVDPALVAGCAALGVDVGEVIAWRAYDAGVVVVLRDGRKLRAGLGPAPTAAGSAAEQEVPAGAGLGPAPTAPKPAKRDKK